MAISKKGIRLKDGEITINLNLNIEVQGGVVSVRAEPGDDGGPSISMERRSMSEEYIPDELFDEFLPTIELDEE